jgi:hypothetical protein
MAFHGQGVYLKSLAQRSPHFPSILEAQAKVTDACKHTPFKAVLVFDYFPMHKVRSISDGVTAFRRENVAAVIMLMLWKAEDDKEDNLIDRARGIANEIAEIVNKGQQEMLITESEGLGYLNYGGSDCLSDSNVC